MSEQEQPDTASRAPCRDSASIDGVDRAPVAVEIRRMELDHLSEVFSLGERVFRAARFPNLYRTWDEHELLDSFGSNGDLCLVAENEERVAGFVIGSVIRKRKSAWTYGYLVWLAVNPELEGRGVARKLVARLTQLLVEAGARIMLVDTDAGNTRGLEFFKRIGFGQPVEHVYLSKNLKAPPRHQEPRQPQQAVDDSGDPPSRRKPPDG